MRTEAAVRRLAGGIGLALALHAGAPRADEIEGVDFPVARRLGELRLPLRGVGVLRYRVLFKGYAAALYADPALPADAVLSDVPRRLEIEYFWSIPAEGFRKATVEGIARNVSDEAYEALRERIERINRLYEDVEPGDRYALSYLPGVGTELALNGVAKGTIPGADFGAAIFAIWLGEDPLDASLKQQLLGEP